MSSTDFLKKILLVINSIIIINGYYLLNVLCWSVTLEFFFLSIHYLIIILFLQMRSLRLRIVLTCSRAHHQLEMKLRLKPDSLPSALPVLQLAKGEMMYPHA